MQRVISVRGECLSPKMDWQQTLKGWLLDTAFAEVNVPLAKRLKVDLSGLVRGPIVDIVAAD